MDLPNKLFNMDIVVKEQAELKGYPNVYTSAFTSVNAIIGGVSCIIVCPKGEVKPLQIRKMFANISARENKPCLFACSKLSAYQRRSLSEYGVSWISNEETFHIPFLMASCNGAHFIKPAQVLSANAQRIAIHALDGTWNRLSSTEVSKIMGKSLSSISAYFAQIAAIAPSIIGKRGRMRFIVSPESEKEKSALFAQLKPYLVSPVKNRIYLACDDVALKLCDALLLSGISALSKHTNIADDPWKTQAILTSNKDLLAKILEHSEQVTKNDTPNILLEVWEYDHSEEDLISLYLDVEEYAFSEGDERLDQAVSELKEMMFDEH
jgi:hypothetical protein